MRIRSFLEHKEHKGCTKSTKFFVFFVHPLCSLCSLLSLLLIASCKNKTDSPVLFETITSERTGLDFSNKLTPTQQFNMFNYMYFYNGAGVGAGDFNNDGRTDLFFASNQSRDRIYLNEGDLHFKDVTASSLPADSGWSTGVSVVDINNDGMLDIYVCRVGNYETLRSRNQLLVCQEIKDSIPVYADKAKDYGLDFSGFSTQAAFLDYDLDGDLDMYLMNHSLRYNNTFQPRQNYFGTTDSLSGDKFYRNDGNKFTDVTKESNILSTVIGYGLGIAVSDIDLDGWPDIYIGNDFHENDYLYINQRNGTFNDMMTEKTMHASQFSMGVDIADITNDALPEIITLDMLPEDPYILKRSLGEDSYDLFNYKIKTGYSYQYARNTLQLNRGNGMFSETGLYSGVAATDWSWGALWMDFDNDGWKDLFISNGIPKRLNDIDYVNYVTNDEIQVKIREGKMGEKEMAIIDNFPEIKLPNKFYHNKSNAQFDDIGKNVKDNVPNYSNGAAYADLDNDGDLDVIVNNIDEPALIYKNNNSENKGIGSTRLILRGDSVNIHATGAKVIASAKNETRVYEKSPVRGFQSSMEIPLYVGLGNTAFDSVLLVWPDNTYERIDLSTTISEHRYKKGLPAFNYDAFRERYSHGVNVKDLTSDLDLDHLHVENDFIEFDREQLIPHMVSREGPALAIADINGDSLDDIFVGSSKMNKSAVYIQTTIGFQRMKQPALDADSTYEEVDAAWVDVNGDKSADLVTVSGGNEYYGESEYMQPRVYINDGKGNLSHLPNAFTGLYFTGSCIAPNDFNSDGHMDLFIGARAVPWEYGQMPQCYLLQNDGTGKFKSVTSTFAKDLTGGMVTDATWTDLDKDGDHDLLLTFQWDGIVAYMNDKGSFRKQIISSKKGWWNFATPFDADGDGDIDIVAGNLGENSRLKASASQPIKLYYGDFDGNGKKEQILTYYINGREFPFANKAELEKQLPVLKKKFLYAGDFAKADMNELFGKSSLSKAEVLTADYLSNAILYNDGKMNFTIEAFPWQAQLTPYRDATTTDVNGDGRPDILLGGNFYENNIQMGRYDADFGSVLVNTGNGKFSYQSFNNNIVKGQVRKIREITIKNKKAFVLARNNDKLLIISFQ